MFHRIIRTFHPVGQGAFYSEENIKNGERSTKINAVFDCGSLKGGAWLSDYIKNNFHNIKPDILFLSHYDIDHYNGIKYLKPTYIVLPFLTGWEKAIVWLDYAVELGMNNTNFIDTINSLSPSSKLIKIRPISNGNINLDSPIELNITYDQGMEVEEEIESGRQIKLKNFPDWIYIPINPKLDLKLIDDLKKEFNEKGIDQNKILNCDYDYFVEHKEEIGKIYKTKKPKNNYSMIVYSGPTSHPVSTVLKECKSTIIKNVFIQNVLSFRNTFFYTDFLGCLYLGDIKLNMKIFNKSKQSETILLETIYDLLPKSIFNNLGAIQVPHHGGKDNFHETIFKYCKDSDLPWDFIPRYLLYFISVGKENKYGHPDGDILRKLMLSPHLLSVITDDASTKLIQEGIY